MRIPKKIIKILKEGGIGVLPTDTIYGLVGSALKKETVERIYKIRKRERKKPFIILISGPQDLKIFGIKIKPFQKELIKKFWPGPYSLIFDCKSEKFEYLHRGKKSLAFRVPKPKWLRKILKEAGPLVAPSANLAGMPHSKTIREAKKYFGESVDFYFDARKIDKKPSTLIDIRKKEIKILRK
jgi:L-threonylcarbamoyladenylate synthase